MSGLGTDLFLSPDEQDLLVTALNSNNAGAKSGNNQQRSNTNDLTYTPQTMTNPGSGALDLSDDSPYLDFDPDGDFDDSFGYESGRMIGDLPELSSGDLHDKRKSIDGDDNEDEGDRKRREGDDKTAKKPGRKPLTSEPTSVSPGHTRCVTCLI
jgi:AP-1-like transcription factor